MVPSIRGALGHRACLLSCGYLYAVSRFRLIHRLCYDSIQSCAAQGTAQGAQSMLYTFGDYILDTARSRTSGLRIMFRGYSQVPRVLSTSRSSALETRFQDLILPAWPSSEHTSNATIVNGDRCLDRLRPRRHTEHEHLAQAPDMIGESRRHCRCARPPQLGGATAVRRNRLGQGLAHTGMG
jgi:hypothetical protein